MKMSQDDLAGPPQREYSETDHDTWKRLIERQLKLIDSIAPAMLLGGICPIKFRQKPAARTNKMSAQLNELVGWQLSNAQDEYLKPVDWFIHLENKHFLLPIIFGSHKI